MANGLWRNEENPNSVTWKRLKASPNDKHFFGTVYKRRDFIRLKQGDKIVAEYEAKFSKIVKYASIFGRPRPRTNIRPNVSPKAFSNLLV